ncbi:MAG: ATP-binding cassette domain-containing protein, partial [Candidatus Omnitrophica bacterium]|nr:ATP-binding cassette domain-containing protein [Candidatus Omnitrophota bacterium]
REAGNNILNIDHLSKSLDGQVLFKNFTITVEKGDKIAFVGPNNIAKTTLFQVLVGEIQPDGGNFKWGASTSQAYYPKDNSKYFDVDCNLIYWLRQYSDNTYEVFVRGYLGRMLFSGDESFKQVRVLSGGERVRCMLSRMMLAQPNTLIMDHPTNHLDLESIESLNKGLEKFGGTILFTSHDHQLIQTVANRIIEITSRGFIDRPNITLDEYLSDENIKKQLHLLYS